MNEMRENFRIFKVFTICLTLHIILLPIGEATINTLTNDKAATSVAGGSPVPARNPPPSRVKVNKCCRYDEQLNISTRACVPGNTQHWVPMIFLIKQGANFSPKGQYPKFMSFDESVLPISMAGASNDIPRQTYGGVCNAEEDLELFTGLDIVLFSNGSLYVRERSRVVAPRNFCVDRNAALVCFPQQEKPPHLGLYTKPRVKVKKCCGKHGMYNTSTSTCDFDASNTLQDLPLSVEKFQTIYGFPRCVGNDSESFAIAGDYVAGDFDEETGNINLQSKYFRPMDYCLEYVGSQASEKGATSQKDSGSVKVFTCLHHFTKNQTPALSSLGTPGDTSKTFSEQLQVALLNIGLIISVVFLGATLVAGYLLPSVHHVLHWRCQIYYVFCLFVGESLLAYSQLSPALGTPACTLMASAMHFFFLSAFFWLNTMCFNIWWTFRDFRPSSLERTQEIFRLRLYSAYAWGIPLLIALVALFIDQLPAETELLRPGFGVRSCWFSGESLEIFAYFFGPIGILLCANIVLFISTTHQLTCGLWKRDDVKSSSEKTALGKVCIKLVIVMGVTWIADIISWIVGGPHALWFFTDLINVLQGVFIFLVVGCQPQVRSAVKRLCCPSARQEITNTTNGVHHSSSSHGLPSMTACGEPTQQTTATNASLAISAPTVPTKIPMETVC